MSERSVGDGYYEECPTQNLCDVEDGVCIVCGDEALFELRPNDLFDDSEPEDDDGAS